MSEKQGHQLIDLTKEWLGKIHHNAQHLYRTEYWARKLDPNVDEAIILACLLHDIEREFHLGRRPPVDETVDSLDNPEYLFWHGQRSAEIAGQFLSQHGANQDLVAKVTDLIKYHEVGGGRERDLVKDADSLSLLEMHALLFCDFVPQHNGIDRIKQNLKQTLNKISNPEGKKLGNQFYRQAINQLTGAGYQN